MADVLDGITVNMETGDITYPALEGFTLDVDKVYSTARLFTAHTTVEQAVRLAIHQQIAAFKGLRQTLAGLR